MKCHNNQSLYTLNFCLFSVIEITFTCFNCLFFEFNPNNADIQCQKALEVTILICLVSAHIEASE